MSVASSAKSENLVNSLVLFGSSFSVCKTFIVSFDTLHESCFPGYPLEWNLLENLRLFEGVCTLALHSHSLSSTSLLNN